ncbi:hypothetical protein ACWD25_40375, partial [Streptomyces sp. NPDC002920]
MNSSWKIRSTWSTWASATKGPTVEAALARARLWARVAVALVLGCVAVVAGAAGSGGWLVLFTGIAGLALAGAGVW